MAYLGLILFIASALGMFLSFTGVGLNVPGFTKLGLEDRKSVV